MKGQALGPMKQGEERKGPTCQDQRIKESSELGRDPQRLPRAQDPRDMQHN